VSSTSGDADLEIGLQWDRNDDKLHVSLRFEIFAENVYEWRSLEEPLSIDVSELGRLMANEEAYGAALTRMVMREDVKELYLLARARTDHVNTKLHVRLLIAAPARFHALRWELLRDPSTGTPIAMRPNLLWSRYLSSPDWQPIPPPAKHELRALIVVAGPRGLEEYRPNGRELGQVEVEEELARAQTALAGISDVRKLEGPATLPKIIEALNRGVDVLYLVCHGVIVDDAPLLYLEDSDRKVHVVDGRSLVERLSDLERRPMVVMLSSCQSASTGTEVWSADDGELSALGPRLAAAGVAAVVAMQGNISMRTAESFASAFFTALAEHGIVDEAMAVARRAVRDQPDWWVPVLFSRLRSGRTYYRSGFTARGEDTWTALAEGIKVGDFTPVIGPLLAKGIIGSREDIARHWVRKWHMPLTAHNQEDLAQVAQYLRVRTTEDFIRKQLLSHLMNEITQRQRQADPEDVIWQLPRGLLASHDPAQAISEVGRRLRTLDQGDPYRILAELDASVYVTTGWTDLLQDALKDNGRDPITMTFLWKPSVVPPWEVPVGTKKPKTDAHVEPTLERPLVYHLYGRLDDLDSVVLTEDDYFTWLMAWNIRRKSVPPSVLKAVTAKSLLFLGYRMDDWDFRVVFHIITSLGGRELLRRHQHVGVQLPSESQMIEPAAVQQYFESYFREAQISIYWGETRQFLNDMRLRIAS
jgi:CHAT domain/SIR2-like domain